MVWTCRQPGRAKRNIKSEPFSTIPLTVLAPPTFNVMDSNTKSRIRWLMRLIINSSWNNFMVIVCTLKQNNVVKFSLFLSICSIFLISISLTNYWKSGPRSRVYKCILGHIFTNSLLKITLWLQRWIWPLCA